MNAAAFPQLPALKAYYNSGLTRPYAFRRQQLQVLKKAIYRYEHELHAALYADLKKSSEESWITEMGFVISEINFTLRHLSKWMKRQRVPTNLVNQPSRSYIYKEPLGVVLIIGPWNYPLQLLFIPLIGAIAAGNCAVLKPSELAPATASVLEKIVHDCFDNDYIWLVQGEGATIVPALMNHFRFDHVFFTGGTVVGKKVYEMAAQQLVPVTLELGGKSPCIIESNANIAVAARRIAITKFSNAGQMCVAPDYVLVHASVKEAFLKALISVLQQFFGTDASASYNYGKIINKTQFDRIIPYLQQGTVVYGGQYNAATQYIAPTVMQDISLDDPIMHEELFAPVLPVLSFHTFKEAKAIIDRNPDPLAFYVFSESSDQQQQWIEHIPFGSGCINNAGWQLTNYHLPFGGRGNSGIGAYHGKFSFDVFSHQKAVMKTPAWFDPKLKYPPFKGKLGWFKKIIR